MGHQWGARVALVGTSGTQWGISGAPVGSSGALVGTSWAPVKVICQKRETFMENVIFKILLEIQEKPTGRKCETFIKKHSVLV